MNAAYKPYDIKGANRRIILILILTILLSGYGVFGLIYLLDASVWLGAAAATLTAGVSVLLAAFLFKRVSEPYFKKLMYNDFVSGLPNRLAYEHRFRDYEAGGAPLERVMMVLFDMNELKYINDTYGHSVGDIAIKRHAQMIDDAFKNQGGAYRIGGDELAVFIVGEKPETVRGILGELFGEERYIYKNLRFNVACGMAAFDPAVDKNLHDVFDRADKAMYENKRAVKGDQR